MGIRKSFWNGLKNGMFYTLGFATGIVVVVVIIVILVMLWLNKIPVSANIF